MWVEFDVDFLLCSERFFSGYSGFPLFSKTKFQFDQKSGRRITTMWMCYLQIVIYLFIICKIVKNLKMPSARSAKAVSLVKNGHIIGFVPWDAG